MLISRDTTLCISLAGRPSNLGTRFHNRLYAVLGLDFVYKAFTTDDIEGAIRGVRALGIRGCSVSMPFKEAVIPLVDALEPSASAIGAVNTIVHDGGRLTASNTDVEAVAELLRRRAVDPAFRVAVRGSGGMARAVVAAFRDAGFEDLTVVARNEAAGRALAGRSGYRWSTETPPADLLVNVTPLGMAGADADALAFDPARIDGSQAVFDVVAVPAETPLVRAARIRNLPVITGADVHALQAAFQFRRYTGVTPSDARVAEAHAFARSEEGPGRSATGG